MYRRLEAGPKFTNAPGQSFLKKICPWGAKTCPETSLGARFFSSIHTSAPSTGISRFYFHAQRRYSDVFFSPWRLRWSVIRRAPFAPDLRSDFLTCPLRFAAPNNCRVGHGSCLCNSDDKHDCLGQLMRSFELLD